MISYDFLELRVKRLIKMWLKIFFLFNDILKFIILIIEFREKMFDKYCICKFFNYFFESF